MNKGNIKSLTSNLFRKIISDESDMLILDQFINNIHQL